MLTSDEMMSANGFLSFNKTKTLPKINIYDIFQKLHQNDPIIQLKQLGMFSNNRNKIPSELKYTGIYKINEKPISASYLYEQIYTFQKNIVHDSKIVLNNKDFSFDLPLSKIIIYHNDVNIPIDEKLYDIGFKFKNCDEFFSLESFEAMRYINEFESYETNKAKHFINIIPSLEKFYMTEYIDEIKIFFNCTMKSPVNVKVKLYNIYNYGGFFSSGWSFSD
jgi:hypothetical protein